MCPLPVSSWIYITCSHHTQLGSAYLGKFDNDADSYNGDDNDDEYD